MPSRKPKQRSSFIAEERASLFRQNIAAELERLRWTRSATKHRISRARIRYALEHCLVILEEDPPVGHPRTETRLVFLGEDRVGVALEVIAVEGDYESLVVIHAMRLRPRYQGIYEGVRRCIK